MEKLTEVHIRKALVDKIKETGLKEIEEEKRKLKGKMDELDITNESDYVRFDAIIRDISALNDLKDFLNADTMFGIEAVHGNNIYYIIPSETLEIWLEEGVVSKYLTYINTSQINLGWITDRFFGYTSGFVTILEKTIHEEKKKERK